MPRPKQRTPRLREHVLVVAMETLEREGVAAFTARRIAERASTSLPALYELFGDKAGLVRELFFEGFRSLRRSFDELGEADDPREGVVTMVQAFRRFAREHPILCDLMFARPFADFEPGRAEQAAGKATRDFILGRVRRCIEAGVLAGDENDIAHVLLALAQGLATQENGGWLGTSKASIERRWKLAVEVALAGFAPR